MHITLLQKYHFLHIFSCEHFFSCLLLSCKYHYNFFFQPTILFHSFYFFTNKIISCLLLSWEQYDIFLCVIFFQTLFFIMDPFFQTIFDISFLLSCEKYYLLPACFLFVFYLLIFYNPMYLSHIFSNVSWNKFIPWC